MPRNSQQGWASYVVLKLILETSDGGPSKGRDGSHYQGAPAAPLQDGAPAAEGSLSLDALLFMLVCGFFF